MADESAKLRVEVDGTEQFLVAADAVESFDKKLTLIFDSAGRARNALGQFVATASQLGEVSKKVGDVSAKAGGAVAGLTESAIRGGRAVGESGNAAYIASSRLLVFAQAADDAQYGVRSLVNNVPQLAMAMGAGMGLAGAVSIVAVGANQLINYWDALDRALSHSGGTVGQLINYWTDLYRTFTQSTVPTETDRLNELAKATGLAASEQERLNRANAGDKGAKNLATNPIEVPEEDDRQKQFRQMIADRGGSEAIAARIAAQADRQGETIDTGKLDPATRDTLRRAQERLTKASAGGRIDPKTGMPTGEADPEAIEAARRELEIERKRARAVQARREIADAAVSPEGQDALARRLGQLGLSRDAEGLSSKDAAIARENAELNKEGQRGEDPALKELAQARKEQADRTFDLAAAETELVAARLKANEAARKEARDKETDLLNQQGAANEAAFAPEIEEARRLNARKEARKARRVDAVVDQLGGAFGVGPKGIDAAMLAADARGEKSGETDQRLVKQTVERLKRSAPQLDDNQRLDAAARIVENRREQLSDFAMQRGVASAAQREQFIANMAPKGTFLGVAQRQALAAQDRQRQNGGLMPEGTFLGVAQRQALRRQGIDPDAVRRMGQLAAGQEQAQVKRPEDKQMAAADKQMAAADKIVEAVKGGIRL